MSTYEATASIAVTGLTAATIPLLTAKDVKEALKLRHEYRKARKALERLEEQSKAATLKVLETVLGIKSLDEIKLLTPEKVQALYNKRKKQNKFFIEDGAPEFAIERTSNRRAVEWKEVCIEMVGESKVTDILNNAEEHYTYSLKEAK